jgi:hypothetical protein
MHVLFFKKAFPFFLAVIFVLIAFTPAQAQTAKDYYVIQVVNAKNKAPIPNTRVIVGDKEYLTNEQGIVSFNADIEYKIEISAAGYRRTEPRLRNLRMGSSINVISLREQDEVTTIHIYVKDTKNRPVGGVEIWGLGGVVRQTDGSGYVRAEHKELPGEYLTIKLVKKGYKTSEHRVLVGTGQGNAITRADDYAHLTIEEKENDNETVGSLVVEVLDYKTNLPVTGASVQLKMRGDERSASTNSGGKALFNNLSGENGLSARIIVKHPKYEEKWSEIGDELMHEVEGGTRSYVVYLTKKAETKSFEITSVSLPANVKANGKAGSLSVTWNGNPEFPVKLVFAPDKCPPGLTCLTVTESFSSQANPLVVDYAPACWGTLPSDIFMDYSVYLVDAKGTKTKLKNADFTCNP